MAPLVSWQVARAWCWLVGARSQGAWGALGEGGVQGQEAVVAVSEGPLGRHAERDESSVEGVGG